MSQFPSNSWPSAEPINPYAAPAAAAPGVLPHQQPAFAGLWRQSNVLVMHKNAPLPPICLMSNEPSTQWLKRKLRWHQPWLFLLVLVNLLIYAIVASIMAKWATIQIGLNDEWMARRRTRMLIAWGIVAVGLLMGVAGIVLGDWGPNSEGFIGLLVLGFFLPIGALVYGQYACRLVYPQRITDQYVYLCGVNPAFLDRLPVWPYGDV